MNEYFINFKEKKNNNFSYIERNNNKTDFKNILKCYKIKKNYYNFFLFFFAGIGILFISFILFPKLKRNIIQYIFLFSIGCIIIIFSFVFYYGPTEFIVKLNKKLTFIIFCIIIIKLIVLYIIFN